MDWLRRLEKKAGRLAIRNLMGYIVGLNALVFLLSIYDRSGQFMNSLTLIPYRVLEGEIWRLVTFLFIPPTRSPIFIIFILYFYFMVGNSLENQWGTFKFNFYYFLGALGTVFAAFITGDGVNAVYLNLSLFLAFATLNPDFTILLFFVLPVKMKYMAYFTGIYLGYEILVSSLPVKAAVVVALTNYLLFFGGGFINRLQAKSRRRKYRSRIEKSKRDTVHRCTVCGLTEKDDPDMRFRYCTKCNGTYEYCSEHLENHKHK
ncbi:MAG: rhomboid family intramembrane serine protease [Halanaerobiaceae bacterium]